MSTVATTPDLLRRFIATPHRFGALLCSTVISFETNDQELLTAFRAGAEHLAGALVSSSQKPWYWKVIRDYDVVQVDVVPFVLEDETLSTLFVGTGTVAAVDWESRELLGFIAANISAQYLLDALINLGNQHR
jgi:hypothetical protein